MIHRLSLRRKPKRTDAAIGTRAAALIERPGGEPEWLPEITDARLIRGFVRGAWPQDDRPDLARFLTAIQRMIDAGVQPAGQLAQDAFALAFTSGPGVFLDIGAAHPTKLSNTVVLQRTFGWTGYLVEPNPLFAELLRNERQDSGVHVAQVALARNRRSVQFLPAAELGSFDEYLRSDLHAEERTLATAAVSFQTLVTTPVDDFLKQTRLESIDFLSVDTEGAELEIMSAFPFSSVRVRSIAVEHNNRPEHEARLTALLYKNGFRRVLPSVSAWDGWFVRRTDAR